MRAARSLVDTIVLTFIHCAMKPRTADLVLFSFLLAAIWAPADADAYCAGSDPSQPDYDPHYYSVSHEFQRAKYVVRARVTRETWLGEDGTTKPLTPPFQNGAPRPWGFDPYLGAYYVVKILHAFKGDPSAELRLFSENSTARFWFALGSEHILFITEESFDPPIGEALTIDTCGNSAAIQKAHATLRAIERLSTAR